MAVFKCLECGHVMENRCKPRKCKSCGANDKDKIQKEEQKKD